MTNYAITAYAIGLALLWGYAGLMWIETRAVARRAQNRNIGGPRP
jgi:hypothetical protein